MIRHLLFDLDGTLLKMDMEGFMTRYFRALAGEVCPLGYEKQAFLAALTAGIAEMQKNAGTRTNEEAFWAAFERETGKDSGRVHEVCDRFYTGNFNAAKEACGPVEGSREALKLAREKGLSVVLATNPVFPRVGVLTRLEWAGLRESDFDYITTYETEKYCKPSLLYYTSIAKRLGYRTEECLMVGNDEYEDMYGCVQAEMQGYLLTDGLIPSAEHPFSGNRGTMSEFLNFLRDL